MNIFVPKDFGACALGSDAIAQQLRSLGANVKRNGSRGLYWLEPMIEIETEAGRIAFGPMSLDDVEDITLLDQTHEKFLGRIDDIPEIKAQNRQTFVRCGIIESLNFDDYKSHDGMLGYQKASKLSSQQIIDEIKTSGLRGRGGAGFPTGIKWQTVLDAPAEQKYIVCNADEGDSATFADRMIMEGDPFCLIEGMVIAALAVGATKGYVYLRSEYPLTADIFEEALHIARTHELLGAHFDIELRIGAGAYVCGEETALLDSLEGKRGVVRAKPPLPALEGLFGKPTVVNNVLSLASIPTIIANGGEAYNSLGFERSRGTMPVQVGGNVARGGLFEVEFGTTIGDIINKLCGGTRTGKPVKAMQIGGPLGAYFGPEAFDMPLDYETFAAADGLIGHAGITIFDEDSNLAKMARFAMEFCAIESCGKCTPCRLGSTRGIETIDHIIAGNERNKNLQILLDLCDMMKAGSLCALGGFAPYPVLSALKIAPQDFGLNAQDIPAE